MFSKPALTVSHGRMRAARLSAGATLTAATGTAYMCGLFITSTEDDLLTACRTTTRLPPCYTTTLQQRAPAKCRSAVSTGGRHVINPAPVRFT
jgi:hypothetical protein